MKVRASRSRIAVTPTIPALTLPGNRTNRPAIGRTLRRSVGSRYFWAVRASQGDRLSTTPNPCFALRLLAKFDTRQIRQRLPALGQVLQGAPTRAGAAEFPTLSIAPTALSLRLRFGKSDRSTCHWQVAQTVLWHPVFAGGAGRSGGLAQSPGYLPSAAEATPQRLRSVMAELAQSPQESLNRFCADLCNEISGG